MASLADLCGIYPILEAICESLHFVDLLRLSQVHPTIHSHLTNRQAPKVSRRKFEKHFTPNSLRAYRSNPTWSNLVRKTDRACQDPAHVERHHLETNNARLWIRTIRESLGCPSAQPCRGCDAYVCFPCWWGRVTTDHRRVRGNRRGKPACQTCWESPLMASGADDLPKIRMHHGSWQDAYEQKLFCDCGPAFFCSHCSDALEYKHKFSIKPLRDSNGHAVMSYTVDMVLPDGRIPPSPTLFSRGEGEGYIKCSTCPAVLHESDAEPIRTYCNICKLPMRMRRHDHDLQSDYLSTQDPLRIPRSGAGLSVPPVSLTDSRGHAVFKVDVATGRRARVMSRTEGYDYPETSPNPHATYNLSTHYEDFEEHWKWQSYFWVRMMDLKGDGHQARLEADDGVVWEHVPRKDIWPSRKQWESYWNLRETLYGRSQEGKWHKSIAHDAPLLLDSRASSSAIHVRLSRAASQALAEANKLVASIQPSPPSDDWLNRHKILRNESRYFTSLRKSAWEFEEVLFRLKKAKKFVPLVLDDV
ncbi:hypothetical protein K491DRAFT_126173 [Lophiostoma macrostomum CBS 122681]|uniref:Uncharacterized protein n=1 Tax=Lophiostoma macrostomum CBS 122681 TaxID=1314788 RepID=A0A6A6SS14_9PLEO|nr:hypothetical protein K491DRAFT_126173 [Lophiostoma macrostomum CBS 122681]